MKISPSCKSSKGCKNAWIMSKRQQGGSNVLIISEWLMTSAVRKSSRVKKNKIIICNVKKKILMETPAALKLQYVNRPGTRADQHLLLVNCMWIKTRLQWSDVWAVICWISINFKTCLNIYAGSVSLSRMHPAYDLNYGLTFFAASEDIFLRRQHNINTTFDSLGIFHIFLNTHQLLSWAKPCSSRNLSANSQKWVIS